ncbi:MAG: hypothetical protein UV97_C0010G0004 [Candidatus Yanofskybacteria bacterium GW2011_GWF2_43_596]|nr:MAG: hypothetical protein UV97_C0010G0004 [Candidatus Yanofskybacteria bacterium GW2011_GWF2_43_596]
MPINLQDKIVLAHKGCFNKECAVRFLSAKIIFTLLKSMLENLRMEYFTAIMEL